MKYTVIWLASAESNLAHIWLAANDRDSITRAARAIDTRLDFQPQTAGESRPAGKRILIVAPLGVTFQVYPQDGIVRVADVWKIEMHRRS